MHLYVMCAYVHRVFNSICTPYNGEDLVWHPVSPSMSSMGYQSPDASQNVELKKGNIASFFKTTTKRDAKPATQTADTKRGKAALQQDAASRVTSSGIKAEPAVSQLAHYSTAEASKSSAAEANVDLGQVSTLRYKEMQQMHSGQSERQSNTHYDADVKVEDSVIDLAKDEGNPEATSNDILNTDDAGGIGMLVTVWSAIDCDVMPAGQTLVCWAPDSAASSYPAYAQMQQVTLQIDAANSHSLILCTAHIVCMLSHQLRCYPEMCAVIAWYSNSSCTL